MAMSGTTWGSAINAAVSGLTIPDDRVITAGELETFWQAIASEHVTHISGNADTSSTGTTGVGTPGGPLPITALPGTVS